MSRNRAIPTTATTYLRPLYRLLRERGHDADALFRLHGVDVGELGRADARVPVAVTRELLEQAQALTREPALGLALVRHTEYTTFGGLGLALAAGGSVRSVLERIARYNALISDAVTLRVEEVDDSLVVVIRERSDPPPHPQSILFLIATVIGLGRLRLAGDAPPRRVVLRGIDEAGLDAARKYFRCEVTLGDEYRVETVAGVGSRVLDGSDPEMAAMLEQTLKVRLPDDERPLSVQLALWLESRFPDGEPSLADAAASLHLSERSLQRRLREENLTWLQLLDDTRRTLAERHLHAPGMSLTQLAFLLGFADVSSFSRAFRKWYGMPASEYRRGAGKG